MRDLVQQDIGLGLAAQRMAIPAEVEHRASWQNSHAKQVGKGECLRVMSEGGGALGATRGAGACNAAEDGSGQPVEACGERVQNARQKNGLDRREDHLKKA